MNPDKQTQLNLVTKYLAGESTPEEAMLLEDWLKDKENKLEFDRISKLWHLVSETPAASLPDKRQAWIELQAATGINEKPKVRKIRFYHYATAACIAALIIISTVTLFNDRTTTLPANDLITKGLGNEVVNDTMPDGSRVTLNRNSSLTYESSFNTTAREVALKGESYFDIMPDRSKPFIISVDDLKIKVIGTSFNVRTITDRVEVQVKSGIVKLLSGDSEITVIKGQTGIYTKNDRSLKLIKSIDLNSISYATKSFYFQDMALREAFKYLEVAFNVTINFDDKKFSGCRLTAEFENKPMNYILDVISATLDINYKISGKTIHIIGEGCK